MNITKGFSKFSITKDIRQILVNDTELTGWVGVNIYPVMIPENVTGDTILYSREKYGKEYASGLPVKDNCQLSIVVISSDYSRSIEITERINSLIEGVHLNTDNYKYQCKLIDSSEDYIDKKYFQFMLFEVV